MRNIVKGLVFAALMGVVIGLEALGALSHHTAQAFVTALPLMAVVMMTGTARSCWPLRRRSA